MLLENVKQFYLPFCAYLGSAQDKIFVIFLFVLSPFSYHFMVLGSGLSISLLPFHLPYSGCYHYYPHFMQEETKDQDDTARKRQGWVDDHR